MSRLLVTNKSFELLEPYEGKLSCTVLRGEGAAMPLTYPMCRSRATSLWNHLLFCLPALYGISKSIKAANTARSPMRLSS